MICLITGSSRGLGRAIALNLGGKGHKVAVHYKSSKGQAEQVSSTIGESIVLQADINIGKEMKSLIDSVIDKWGRIDLLVNNAGITRESLIIKTSEDEFDNIMNTNLKGPYHLIRAAGRQMMKQKEGHIINISSFAGMKGKEGLGAYSASKGALIGLTRSAAKELSRYNIMVNAILPGYMLTDMGRESTGRGKDMALKESIIKDYSDPENVAEFVSYLSSIRGITGQVFNLDSRVI